MATYVCLAKWTQQGIENIKDSPSRLSDAKKALDKEGGSLKEFYMTMGSYDMVCVAEAPGTMPSLPECSYALAQPAM